MGLEYFEGGSHRPTETQSTLKSWITSSHPSVTLPTGLRVIELTREALFVRVQRAGNDLPHQSADSGATELDALAIHGTVWLSAG